MSDPKFGESGVQVVGFPGWAEWLLRFGHGMATVKGSDCRRYAFVSMPCDSGCAGLVALGALLGRLGDASANELEIHQERIRNAQIGTEVRQPEHQNALCRKKGRIDGLGDFGIKVSLENADVTLYIREGDEGCWRFENGPLIQSRTDIVDRTQVKNLISMLGVDWSDIAETNLKLADHGLVLASQPGNRKSTINRMNALTIDGHGLAGLMCLMNAQPSSRQRLDRATRIWFFMPSKGNGVPEELPATPEMVVCDGIASFLKVRQDRRFERASLICVHDRQGNREKLEQLNEGILSLRQFGAEEADNTLFADERPDGIGVLVLERRT